MSSQPFKSVTAQRNLEFIQNKNSILELPEEHPQPMCRSFKKDRNSNESQHHQKYRLLQQRLEREQEARINFEAALQRERAALQRERAALQRERAIRRNLQLSLEEKMTAMTTLSQRFQQEREAREKKQMTLQSQKEQLKMTIDKSVRKIESLERIFEHQRNIIVENQIIINQQKARITELENMIERQGVVIVKLENRNLALEKKILQIEEENKTMRSEKNQLQRRFQKLQTIINELKLNTPEKKKKTNNNSHFMERKGVNFSKGQTQLSSPFLNSLEMSSDSKQSTRMIYPILHSPQISSGSEKSARNITFSYESKNETVRHEIVGKVSKFEAEKKEPRLGNENPQKYF